MAREFICLHCCTAYRGTVSLGDVVTCEACGEAFPVLPFFGDQNGLLRMMGGRLFEAVVGQKCPNCGVRDAKASCCRRSRRATAAGDGSSDDEQVRCPVRR